MTQALRCLLVIFLALVFAALLVDITVGILQVLDAVLHP